MQIFILITYKYLYFNICIIIDMNHIFLSQRKDGKGAHFIMNLPEFLLSKYLKINLNYQLNYKICTGDKLEKSMYFKPIFDNGIGQNIYQKSSIKYYDGCRGPAVYFCETSNQDVISYFNENFKKSFYDILLKEAKLKDFTLPWKNNKNIICINIRLEDIVKYNPITKALCSVNDRKDYDGQGSFNYIKKLIENKEFSKYNIADSNKHSLDTQAPIDPNKLIALIEKFQKEYPDKEIYIVTYCKIIPLWLEEIIKKYKIHIFHKNNEDYDLWLMIHCDILVLAKSTYSIMGGIYHQGSQVYYPYWGTNASLGLGSKYDKSGWIGYV